MSGVRTRIRVAVISIAVLASIVAIPQIASAGQLFFANTVVIAIIFATSTNLLFGQAGIPSFGQAGFFGAGAYAAALSAQAGMGVLLSLLTAMLVAAGIGAIAALVAWRSTGLAFSMLTLAFAQSLYTIAIRSEWLGGYNGLSGLSFDSVVGVDLSDPGFVWYFVVVVAVVVLALYRLIQRSAFGYALRAIKDDPVRALFLGLNIRAYRVGAFVLAAAGAGVAGGMSAYVNQVVTPDSLYWTASAVPVMMLVLGGMGAFFGPAIGAISFASLEHYLSAWTNSYIFYMGALVLVVLMVLPRGLVSIPGVVADRIGSRKRNEDRGQE